MFTFCLSLFKVFYEPPSLVKAARAVEGNFTSDHVGRKTNELRDVESSNATPLRHHR